MQANYANALCHLNATPLSVAVFVPCAWGGNLACGVAWQSVLNSTTHNTANSAWQVWRKWVVLAGEASTAKMGQFGRGTSLSLSLLALFGTPLR